jgi:hypothetical protein
MPSSPRPLTRCSPLPVCESSRRWCGRPRRTRSRSRSGGFPAPGASAWTGCSSSAGGTSGWPLQHHGSTTWTSQAMIARPGSQELPPGRPGPAGRRIDVRGVHDPPHRGRRDRMTEPRQLLLDSRVPQAGFSRATQTTQRLDRGPGGRPSWPAPTGVVPLAGDEVAVPAQDRDRGDREVFRPPAAAHQPRQGRLPAPARMFRSQPAGQLAAQHLVLVAEHQQLGVLGQVRADQHPPAGRAGPHRAADERQRPEMVPAPLPISPQNHSSHYETEFPSRTG